jgi:hypothetical protein
MAENQDNYYIFSIKLLVMIVNGAAIFAFQTEPPIHLNKIKVFVQLSFYLDYAGNSSLKRKIVC